MHPILRIVLIIAVLPLGGCLFVQARINWNKAHGIPIGSKVILKQQLHIPASETQAFLQNGRASYYRGYYTVYDEYYPFCFFEVNDPLETMQSIEPDVFTVYDVYFYETEVVQKGPTRLAGLFGYYGGDSARLITRTVTMKLKSAAQPHVRKLECAGGFELEHYAELPTLQDIRRSLGDIVELQLKGKAP